MFLTPHALAGMVVAKYLPNPFLVFFLSILLHFILDFIPHGDDHILSERYYKNPKDNIVLRFITIDLACLLVIIILTFFNVLAVRLDLALIGILGGIIPDLFVNLHLHLEKFFSQKKIGPKSVLWRHEAFHTFLVNHYRLHNFIHFLLKIKIPFGWGIVIQLFFSLGALILIR